MESLARQRAIGGCCAEQIGGFDWDDFDPVFEAMLLPEHSRFWGFHCNIFDNDEGYQAICDLRAEKLFDRMQFKSVYFAAYCPMGRGDGCFARWDILAGYSHGYVHISAEQRRDQPTEAVVYAGVSYAELMYRWRTQYDSANSEYGSFFSNDWERTIEDFNQYKSAPPPESLVTLGKRGEWSLVHLPSCSAVRDSCSELHVVTRGIK